MSLRHNTLALGICIALYGFGHPRVEGMIWTNFQADQLRKKGDWNLAPGG